MRSLQFLSLTLLGLISAAAPSIAETEFAGKGLRRLYDLTPASVSNPVVARVRECNIEITAGEFRAHIASLPSEEGKPPRRLTLAEKKAELNHLLNDHFLLWDGYQRGADKTQGMIQMLQSTENMLLQETLTSQEVLNKAKTPEEYRKLASDLRDRIFEKSDVTVSNESYEALKTAAKTLNAGDEAKPATATPISDKPASPMDKLAPEVRDRPLAKCKLGVVTIGDFLGTYMSMPPEKRPNLEEQQGVTSVLKTMLEDGMLTMEARERGLVNAPIVQEKMLMNLNVLSRMYAIDMLTADTVAKMKEPGKDERVRKYYDEHLKDRYTYKDEAGKEQVVPFNAENRESIENDYFQDLQEKMRLDAVTAMRQGKKIEIDEEWLKNAPLAVGSAAAQQ